MQSTPLSIYDPIVSFLSPTPHPLFQRTVNSTSVVETLKLAFQVIDLALLHKKDQVIQPTILCVPLVC